MFICSIIVIKIVLMIGNDYGNLIEANTQPLIMPSLINLQLEALAGG